MSRARRFAAILLRWGLIVLGVYLAICVFAYYYQPRLLYFPLSDIEDTPSQNGMPFEDVFLATSDGLRVHAWFVPAAPRRPELVERADNAAGLVPRLGEGTVLFSHGNGGNISYYIDTVRIFRGLGLNTLIYDYRGYGRSEGSPSEEGTYRDAEAAWKHLVETRGTQPSEIILFGRSLGGAVAARLAETHAAEEPAALVLESTFTSIPDMAARYYPWLPTRAICRYKYDTLSRLGSIRCPILVVHSPQDDIVPYAMGKTLFDAAGEPKQFLRILGNHNDGYVVSGEEYIAGLRAFFRQVLGREAPVETP